MAAAGAVRSLMPNPNPPSDIVFSDSDASSSNGGEEAAGHRTAFEDSIFAAYLQISGRSAPDLSKIRSFLASASGRGPYVACLICLDRVRPSDPAWSCSSGCYALFHLLCIQSWAHQSSHRPPSATQPATAAASSTDWPCPKCRLPYPRTLIPRSYFCFCGKVEDPPPDPWILPDSCGEDCGRPLSGKLQPPLPPPLPPRSLLAVPQARHRPLLLWIPRGRPPLRPEALLLQPAVSQAAALQDSPHGPGPSRAVPCRIGSDRRTEYFESDKRRFNGSY